MCEASGGVSECDGCVVREREIRCASRAEVPVHEEWFSLGEFESSAREMEKVSP